MPTDSTADAVMTEYVRTPIQVRFADTDAIGHINNATFATYTEVGRIDFFSRIREDVGNLILARHALDLERQIQLTDTVEVLTRVVRLGTSSIHIEQIITANGERAARAEVVVVYFDYATQQPTPIPEDWREAITALDP